jgi:hypothetical protein
MAVFWVVAPCSLAIALIMEAARTSETLVNFYQTTRCYNPEDSHLRTHRRENFKSYISRSVCSRMYKSIRNIPVLRFHTIQSYRMDQATHSETNGK